MAEAHAKASARKVAAQATTYAALMLLAATSVRGVAGGAALAPRPSGFTSTAVTGRVRLAYGAPYLYGILGTTVTVPAEFWATSSNGRVVSYRERLVNTQCLSEAQLNQFERPWQPFVVTSTYIATFTQPNLTAIYLTAQFRDEWGDTSEPACDALVLEGERPTMTPTPASPPTSTPIAPGTTMTPSPTPRREGYLPFAGNDRSSDP